MYVDIYQNLLFNINILKNNQNQLIFNCYFPTYRYQHFQMKCQYLKTEYWYCDYQYRSSISFVYFFNFFIFFIIFSNLSVTQLMNATIFTVGCVHEVLSGKSNNGWKVFYISAISRSLKGNNVDKESQHDLQLDLHLNGFYILRLHVKFQNSPSRQPITNA